MDTISEILDGIATRYRDGRLNLFELTAEQPSPDRCLLSGMVLDHELLVESLRELTSAYPETAFDASEVTVLRQTPVQRLALSTNLAGLHRHPSRTTELMSQLLNGAIVEKLREQDSWIFVRQQDGYLGWVHSAYLTPDQPRLLPTHMVYKPVLPLLAGPHERTNIVSRVFAGTAVPVTDLDGSWAKIELVGGHSGWVPLKDLQPLDRLPQTDAEQRALIAEIAADFIGVPYRWGGSSVYGIDCSGFAQLLHRLVGINIPRDADMQYAAGKPVEPPFQIGVLFYFGSKDGHRSITHVGMSLGGWRMIHSSGPRNGVYEDNLQEANWLHDRLIGANNFISQNP